MSSPMVRPPPSQWDYIGLSVASLALGLIEVWLASTWKHYCGIAVGGIAAGVGAVLLSLHLITLFAGSKRQRRSALISKWWPSIKTTLTALDVFLALFIAVHLASPDQLHATFPAACPPGKLLGCSRVAATAAHNSDIPTPPSYHTRAEVLHRAVVYWIEQQPRATLLKSESTAAADMWVQARFVSGFWGFADDLFVRLSCDGEEAVLEAQGQLRLGKGDLGVNRARLKALIAELDVAYAQNKIERSKCF